MERLPRATRLFASIRSAFLRLVGLTQHKTMQRRWDEEVAAHLEMQAEEFRRRGMDPTEAHRAARVAFGPAEQFREEARDAVRSRLVAELGQDLRHAIRVARRSPLVTTVAVATLALTIGIATFAFSALNAALLRALPYPEPDRLAVVWGTAASGESRDQVSFTNAADWRRDVHAFAELAAFSCTPPAALSGNGPPVHVATMEVSIGFFRVLRAHPMLGRTLDSADFETGHEPVVVLAHPLWKAHFAGDSTVVGRRILLDGAPYTVVGVLPADFPGMPSSLTCTPDFYHPLTVRYDDTQRSWTFLRVIARLRDGASLPAAQAELDVESTRLARAFPASNTGRGARAVLLRDEVTAPIRRALLLIQAGTLLVLLIACANIANLLLARAAARRREFAVRVALGAGRARLSRQVAVECFLVVVTGGALGMALAAVGAGALTGATSGWLANVAKVTPDLRVLGFACGASLVAACIIAFGPLLLAGALGAASGRERDTLSAALRDGGRGATAAQSGVRRVLVAAQVALALVALVDAGLLARSYQRLQSVSPGFDPRGVLTIPVTLPDGSYPRGARQIAFFRTLVDLLAHQTGVTAAGGVNILPESPEADHTDLRVPGVAYAPGQEPITDVYRVTPGYFTALGIPLVAGRQFAPDDDDRHPLVAVINETMSHQLFRGVSPVGRRLWTGAGNTERTIVGVVGDALQYGLDSKPTMQLYVPHADNAGGHLTLVVRTTGDPARLAPGVRDAVRTLDSDIPVDHVQTMEQVLAVSMGRRKLLAGIALALAGGAILLAAVGLYGVIAYAVLQRTSEIGIRAALGASPRDVLGLVVGDGLALMLRGLLIGTALALLTSPLVRTLLFRPTADDAVAYLAAPIVLLGIGLLSCALPAWRATKLSPVIALRAE